MRFFATVVTLLALGTVWATCPAQAETDLTLCAKELREFQKEFKIGDSPSALINFQAHFLFPKIRKYGRTVPLDSHFSAGCLNRFNRAQNENQVEQLIEAFSASFEQACRKNLWTWICGGMDPFPDFVRNVFPDILSHLSSDLWASHSHRPAYSYVVRTNKEIAEILLSTFRSVTAESEDAQASACGDRIWFLFDRFKELNQHRQLIRDFKIWRVYPQNPREDLKPYYIFQHTVAELKFEDDPVPYILDAVYKPAISHMNPTAWARSAFTNGKPPVVLPNPTTPHRTWSPMTTGEIKGID